MKNKLLITDLDGTLLNSQQNISIENKHAILDFIKQGGLFTIATGRGEKSVVQFVRELNITVPMILYNGAKIVNPLSWEVLYEWNYTLPLNIWEKLSDFDQAEVGILFYQDGEVYTKNKNETILTYQKKDNVQVVEKNTPFKEPITKILLIGNSENLHKLENIFRSSELKVSLVYSESTYLEVLPYEVSKGRAIKVLKDHLNLSSIHTMCVGDNLNDCSMLLEADQGVAVENAHPSLKDLADTVTIHHESHAIAHLITSLSHDQGK